MLFPNGYLRFLNARITRGNFSYQFHGKCDGAPHHYVRDASQEIRQNRGILNQVWLSWTRRIEACIENDGMHFEHLLCCSFYAFTHNYSKFTFLFSE
jgi:hypothetical protein